MNAPTAPAPNPAASLDWPLAWWSGALQLQSWQVDAWMDAQRTWSAAVQECWDLWVCHWGGGAPIDV